MKTKDKLQKVTEFLLAVAAVLYAVAKIIALLQ